MALDEIHARRLETMATIFERALDRMELVLKSLEGGKAALSLQGAQIQRARERMEQMRRRIEDALERFSVSLTRPNPRQMLAAELSMLWVILENARPERMKGYGKELTPADRKSWEELIQTLLKNLAELRDCTR
ncbi:MAG: hypothetical protein HY508_10475 [Acidobacteria bacterium]|nr:hypothetical protein [Acidobacteriota bacterium]